tara:strand:- start:10721 stop:11476 length:756 start_codon:yes stop_codon:yes gene_type:complete
MKFMIDTDAKLLTIGDEKIDLFSDEAFHIVSDLWLKVGWNQKYTYTFSWFDVPMIQLPADMLRYQEVVFRLKPDVIVETGIAHGGSAVFSASLCKLIGKGRVVAVDIDIRPHARERLRNHPMKPLITLIEGSSTAPEIVEQIRNEIRDAETVLVMLDSDHSYAHVTNELNAYAPMVTAGSYIICTDGYMRSLTDVPRGSPDWLTDNPANAAIDFVANNHGFVIEEPTWPFNESDLKGNTTHWPEAWIKRVG